MFSAKRFRQYLNPKEIISMADEDIRLTSFTHGAG